ncbi:MAG: hypothetical protein JNK23_18205 [Opitutaceae bacterium]|nr:hypothetical protein [Opitutaceae bacterium]
MKTLLLLLALAGAAAPSPRLCAAATPFIRDLASPAPADSQCSNLAAAPDGTLFLTYSAPAPQGGERALFLSTLAPGAAAWTAPRLIVSSPLLMENWADFASLCVGTDGALTAQWFQKIPGDTARHGYDGWFSRSTDGGKTWRTPAPLGHEFVALAPLSAGRTLAVWLESWGRGAPAAAPHDHGHAARMKLSARLLAPDGSSLGDWTVDPDVCTCCQNTVAVLPGDRVLVGYRGHTPDEIRDDRYTFFDLASRAFSPSKPLGNDRWKIAACPVNGPAADARGDAFAVAWFTAADGVAKVQARHATAATRELGPAVRLDLGRPLGRVETVVLADQSALFLWIEIASADNAAGLYARRLFPDGALCAPRLVADTTQARASGFPRAALRPGGRVVLSFTQAGTPNQVRTVELDPAGLSRP